MSRTITHDQSREEVDVGRLRELVAVFGPSGTHLPRLGLQNGASVIGREGSDLALDDPRVSRRHARVIRDGASVVIVDEDSHNGTFVNGVRVRRAELTSTSVVRVGQTLLLYLEHEVRGGESSHKAAALFGASPLMQRVRGEIGLAAPSRIPVLVLGETGTGKELAARELHRLSRRSGPLVAVNCAGLPEGLAESELFGHVAGAFTSAVKPSRGLFRAAAGGTLLLDEVTELPQTVQAKLLRVLDDGDVRAVGATESTVVDVRVVAMTNREPGPDSTFRADLLARLSGWVIRMPALRERKGDVLALATRFLDESDDRLRLSLGAAEALLVHSYPANVRELRLTMSSAALRAASDGRTVKRRHLAPAVAGVRSLDDGEGLAALPGRKPTKDELAALLAAMSGSVRRVARYLGTDRKQIYRWLEAYGLTGNGPSDPG